MIEQRITIMPARVSLLTLALALLQFCGCHPAAPVVLSPPKVVWNAAEGTFSVLNLPSDILLQLRNLDPSSSKFRSVFQVTVVGGDGTPILGAYKLDTAAPDNMTLRFLPRFPVVAGASYRAVYNPKNLPEKTGQVLESVFAIPRPPLPPPAEVTHVFPSSDRLPENLLRIYLHFSEPMRHGDTYDHIRLLDAAGKPIATPFVTFGEELWDESGKRLTLFLDPGRVKSGLKPREEAGPVLETGKKYTLVIDTGWRDVNGQALAKELRKEFTAVAPIATGIEPKLWTIETPAAGSTAPLTVRFPRALDHALLKRVLQVADAAGKPVDGIIAVESNETIWRYTPREKWSAGRYELIVDSILEDVAGNRVGRSFEVDESRAPAEQNPAPTRLPFVVR